MKRYFSIYLLVVLSFVATNLQAKEFQHPAILSFENGVAPAIAGENSQLSLSDLHYKHQLHSLKWTWSATNAQWNIRQQIPYKRKISGDNEVSTFVFWVYAAKPLVGAALRVEFLKAGKVCSYFNYGLDFAGWRGNWLAFDRDMQGKPEEGMDEMRVTVLGANKGDLYFDHLILSVDEDSRQHTADLQAPYINPETENHWLILLKSWNLKFDIQSEPTISLQQQSGITTIEKRLREFLLEGKKPILFQKIKNDFAQYQIQTNPDGTMRGLPIFQERYGETYNALAPVGFNYLQLYNDASGLKNTTDLMLRMAVFYNKSSNESEKESVAQMFVLLIRHFLDQGFQAGSALGTLHHLGYNIRDYYPSAFLMKEVLRQACLDTQVQQSMEWFAGTGEVKMAPVAPGMDIDAFNTSLVGRLASLLMMNDNPDKVRYLQVFKRWIDNGCLYTDGTIDAFKPDGSVFHHRGNYPAYAIGGLEGAVTANYLLYNTYFQLAADGRTNLKKALLAMRNYCNLQTWPLSLSGRHPDGKGHLIPEQFALLALTGTPDYSEKMDTELAANYLRLETKPNTKFKRLFNRQGITAAESPSGNWSYNYSCLNVHRRADWMVSSMGHSRYLWATETYPNANMYGRYLNYGSLQIMATGNPISNYGSGFNQKGWDWNHFPGTTATVLPMKDLRANVINPDANSGQEEMLLSDEAFAGSLSFQQKQGIFAMKLHENPKYGGSLRARKSFFFFDNRVIALGSDISSHLEGKSVNTTLFQVFLPDSTMPIHLNGAEVKEFPYSKTIAEPLTWLSDGLNNYFFVSNGNMEIRKSLQQSFDEATEQPTQNNFALATVNHGITPRGASYKYMVLVQLNKKELDETVKKTKRGILPYDVIRQDSIAHIVHDKVTGVTGYVFFQSIAIKSTEPIISVSAPCLVMTSKENGKLSISVSDPDLHFYEGKPDVKYDSQGRQVERSVYSMSWIDNPAADSNVELEIKGKWKLNGTSDFITILSASENHTRIRVTCNAKRTNTNFDLEKM